MNFARHQEQAERAGRRLRWLHALASAAVVVAVDAAATLVWHLLFGAASEPPRGFHATNVGVVLGLVAGGAWLETARLREDGALIARRLGAVAVDTVGDPMHRRLQNLLEELAIAARIGVPRAFVIEDEPTINALTAGMDRNQSVVVVTRGALTYLTRDELQGVLAHEVSHVVNGDVRLNTRLVGLNHGLQWVALFGRAMLARAADLAGLLAAGSDARAGAAGLALAVPLAIAGGVVCVIGSLGELAARAIQAGVGRQREYFADAQAIGFTRHRDGLGGALRKVAGQRVGAAAAATRRGAALRHPYWRNVSHLLLAGAWPSRRWFETHPPLRERVHRLYGRHLDPIVPSEPDPLRERREPELPALEFALGAAALHDADERAHGADPASRGATIAGPSAPAGARGPGAGAWDDTRPIDPAAAAGDGGSASAGVAADGSVAAARLVQATREPAGAAALVVALLEARDGPAPVWDDGWACAAARLPALRAAIAALPESALRSLRWPLVELAVARLRPLSRPSRESLLATVRAQVVADGRVTLREWIFFGLLRLRLTPRTAGARLPVIGDPIDARSVRVLFALVAHCAHVSEAKADRAANAAIRALELAPIGGSAGALTLESLEHAVQRAARLPPLARPLLVRQLVALLPPDAGVEVRDFLRLLCVAIDCPVPPLPPRRRTHRADRDDAARHDALVGADAD